MMAEVCFDEKTLPIFCKKLANKDKVFEEVIKRYGFPPFFNRKPGFAALILIILEQQVSLASARAAYNKLKNTIKQVTPKNVLALTDEELRNCYFSRQKIRYVKGLAQAIVDNKLNLKNLAKKPNEVIYKELIQFKGIGPWTIEVYMMMCLQRIDCFPLGDVALLNSMKHEMNLVKDISKEELKQISAQWAPYRTIAAFLFWHAYIIRKNIQHLP